MRRLVRRRHAVVGHDAGESVRGSHCGKFGRISGALDGRLRVVRAGLHGDGSHVGGLRTPGAAIGEDGRTRAEGGRGKAEGGGRGAEGRLWERAIIGCTTSVVVRPSSSSFIARNASFFSGFGRVLHVAGLAFALAGDCGGADLGGRLDDRLRHGPGGGATLLGRISDRPASGTGAGFERPERGV